MILAPARILDATFFQALKLGAPIASVEALFSLHLVFGDLSFCHGFESGDSPKEMPRLTHPCIPEQLSVPLQNATALKPTEPEYRATIAAAAQLHFSAAAIRTGGQGDK